jgi:hypothetical protein
MNGYKRFLFIFFAISFLFLGSMASFNYFIDPLWTFGHSHRFNDVQMIIDERQQKTNRMYFQPFHYDTLILGSSRTTLINQEDFTGMNAFNYAVSNMSIREYDSFLEFAKQQNGEDFKNVIIGVDFFKSSIKESQTPASIDEYVRQTKEPFYRWKNLLSYEVYEYSKRNYLMSKDNIIAATRIYKRDNTSKLQKINYLTARKQTSAKINKFRKEFYGDVYQYNPHYKDYLQILKKKNPNTRFIVFTTPISQPLFHALVEEGRLEDYKRWIRDLVDVFGGIYNFMYPNSITNNMQNYIDGHHFYPEIGTKIAHRIIGKTEDVPKDFGVYVTKENVEEHLKEVEKLARK